MTWLSRIQFLSCILLLLLGSSLEAQEGNNPFDLKNRKDQVEEQPITPPDVESVSETEIESPPPTSPAADNPFNVERNTLESDQTAITPPPTENESAGEAETDLETQPNSATSDNPFNVERNTLESANSNTAVKTTPPTDDSIVEPSISKPRQRIARTLSSFKFLTITFLMVLLALTVTLYKSNISKVYRAFLNDNFLKMVHREQHGSLLALPYLILYILFFISTGIYLFLIAQYFEVSLNQNPLIDLLAYIGMTMLLFTCKHLVLNIISFIFPISKDLKQYSFTIVIFGIILGLLLIPANVLIAFGSSGMTKILIYGSLGGVLLLYLFRILRSLFIASRYITLHKFHFFMYLCTVEIAPLVVLIKAILLKTG